MKEITNKQFIKAFNDAEKKVRDEWIQEWIIKDKKSFKKQYDKTIKEIVEDGSIGRII